MKTLQKSNPIFTYAQKMMTYGEHFINLVKAHQIPGNLVTFKKGETIIKKGAFVSNLLFLKSGFVKIVMQGENSKNFIYDFGVNNWIIDFSLFQNFEVYPFSVQALNPSECYLFQLQDIHHYMEKVPAFALLINNWTRLGYLLNYQRVLTMGTKNNFGRLAEFILYITAEPFAGFEVSKYITRKDIAEYTGMSVESMTRIFNEMKNDKLIIEEQKKLLVNDYEMLMRLSRLG